jgi:hypothetical protein
MSAVLGGSPTEGLDISISAVFAALFLGCAAAHMAIFQQNRKNGHLRLVSIAIFGI